MTTGQCAGTRGRNPHARDAVRPPDRTREVSRPRSTWGCDQLNPGGGWEEAAPSGRLGLHAPGPARPCRLLSATLEQQCPHPPTGKLPAGSFTSPAQLTGHRSTFQHSHSPAGGGTPCDCAKATEVSAAEHKCRKGMALTGHVRTRLPPQRAEQHPGPPPSRPCFPPRNTHRLPVLQGLPCAPHCVTHRPQGQRGQGSKPMCSPQPQPRGRAASAGLTEQRALGSQKRCDPQELGATQHPGAPTYAQAP